MDGADVEAMFRHSCAMGLEGIISKRLDKPYVSGRCTSWVKVKTPLTSAEGATLCISICVGTSILPGMPREQRIEAAREIVAEARKTTGPEPIDTAPRELEKTLLLFCPERAGWQVGQWQDGRWVSTASVEVELDPTHWRPIPSDPPGER